MRISVKRFLVTFLSLSFHFPVTFLSGFLSLSCGGLCVRFSFPVISCVVLSLSCHFFPAYVNLGVAFRHFPAASASISCYFPVELGLAYQPLSCHFPVSANLGLACLHFPALSSSLERGVDFNAPSLHGRPDSLHRGGLRRGPSRFLEEVIRGGPSSMTSKGPFEVVP